MQHLVHFGILEVVFVIRRQVGARRCPSVVFFFCPQGGPSLGYGLFCYGCMIVLVMADQYYFYFGMINNNIF